MADDSWSEELPSAKAVGLLVNRVAGQRVIIKVPGFRAITVLIEGTYYKFGKLNVRVGINAPREVMVDREELYIQKRRGGTDRAPGDPTAPT